MKNKKLLFVYISAFLVIIFGIGLFMVVKSRKVSPEIIQDQSRGGSGTIEADISEICSAHGNGFSGDLAIDIQNNQGKFKHPTYLNLHNADADQLENCRSLINSGLYDIVDIDLQRTFDGVYVNYHGKKYHDIDISEINYYDKKTETDNDPNSDLLSLQSILSIAKEKSMILQIESKCGETDDILSEIAEVIKEYDMMDNVYYSKNSYEILDKSLDYFKNVMFWDSWQPSCTPEQAELLLEKAKSKGGNVIINTSLDYKTPLTPEEVVQYRNKGFLIEIGMNHTENNIAAFEKMFRNYGAENIYSVKIDNDNYGCYVCGYEMSK